MSFQGEPGWSLAQRCEIHDGVLIFVWGRAPCWGLEPELRMPLQLAFLMAELLESMHSNSSFQDFTNDLAPSSWSWPASASISIPALPNWARTSSQSPPSGGRIEPSWPCSARA